MATSTVTPTNGFPKLPSQRVQITVLNDKFEQVTLVKPIAEPPTVSSVEDALAYLGGSQEKLLKLLNRGLVNEAQSKARESAGGWFDKETETPYNGVQLDSEKSNPVILGLAKNVFGDVYAQDPKAAKAQAIAFLQSPGGAPLVAGLILKPETAETPANA